MCASISGRLKVSTRGQAERGYLAIRNVPAIEALLLTHPHVAAFSWVTAPLRDVSDRLMFTELTNLGRAFFDDVMVIATTPDMPATALSQYFEVCLCLFACVSVRVCMQ